MSISGITSRRAEPRDVPAIVTIYNQGIEERIATFETRPRVDTDIMPSLTSRFPIVVVEDAHGVVAFASTSLYRSRDCYAGIAEFSESVRIDGSASAASRWKRYSKRLKRPVSGSSSPASSSRTRRAANCAARSDFAKSASIAATESSMASGAMS